MEEPQNILIVKNPVRLFDDHLGRDSPDPTEPSVSLPCETTVKVERLKRYIAEVMTAARQRQPSPIKPSHAIRVHTTCLAGRA